MAKLSPTNRFHFFSRLPPELRDRIWFFCLPRRVVPLDDPVWTETCQWFPSHESEQQCWAGYSRVYHRARAPPFVACVCREARQVAFRWGGVKEMDSGVSICFVWIQPKLDILLSAWSPVHSAEASHDEDMMGYFLWEQRRFHPGAPVCLMADHVYKFYSNPSAPESNYTPVLRMDDEDSIVYLLRNAKRRDEEDEEDLRPDLSVPMDVDVAMETVYIHATKADVLASQLFGRIADEPSQLVDYDDVATLAKFRTLFNKNPKNQQRVALTEKFNAIESSEFPAQVTRWLAKATWKLLALKWLHEKQHNPLSNIFRDPAQVFERPHVFDTFLHMEHPHHFKDDHPWVIEETERLPKLRPKIWFAYCTKDCQIKTEAKTKDEENRWEYDEWPIMNFLPNVSPTK